MKISIFLFTIAISIAFTGCLNAGGAISGGVQAYSQSADKDAKDARIDTAIGIIQGGLTPVQQQ